MTGGRPAPQARSSSLRGNSPAAYLHSTREEQLYKLVSDLSDACRQDNNANALRDLKLIDSLEKNAKDILSHRGNQDPSPSKTADIARRRRLSIERNASSDDEGTRLQRGDRSAQNGGTTAPTRYNMPTFFSRSNLTLPPSMRGAAKSEAKPRRGGMAAFDTDDEDDSHVPDYASRETTIDAREALCSLDALSMDERSMIGNPTIFSDDKHSNDDDDIESIMQHAKGSVLNQYDTSEADSKPAAKPRANSREIFRQTQVAADPKRGRHYAPPTTSSQSLVGRPRPATFLDTPSTGADDTWKEGGDYVYTHLGSKIFGKATKDKIISVSSSASLGPRAKPAFVDAKLSDVASPQAKVSLMGRTGSGDSYGGSESDDGYLPLRGYQYQTTPRHGGVDNRQVELLEKQKAALEARVAAMEADWQHKVAALEASVAEKDAACASLRGDITAKEARIASLAADLAQNDSQWKLQFEAAHAALEASVAKLEAEKVQLQRRLETYEPQRPASINLFSQRIIWHLKEILREDEADSAPGESEEARAKATRVAALVNRFEKSNAQVQANFAQQLRHDIKTIGIRAFEDHPENSASKAKLQETIADLTRQLREQAAAMDALAGDAKNQQNQLEMALQTAMGRDADVMELEARIARLQEATTAGADVGALEQQLANKEAALASAESTIATLETAVSDLKASVAAKDQELSAVAAATPRVALEATSKAHASELASLQAELAQLRKAKCAVEAQVATLETTLQDTQRQLEDALVPTVEPVAADECVKKVRFEDDVLRSSDAPSVVHLQHVLKRRDEDLAELKSELYERVMDVNALRAEVLAKTQTIERLTTELTKAQQSSTQLVKVPPPSTQLVAAPPSVLLAHPDMAKMEMFLFNSLCAKQQEVDDLLLELDRREEAVRSVCAAEMEALAQEIKVLEDRYAEMSGALKLAHEQQAHLEKEAEMQGRSIDNKQKQIKSLIALMAEKEAELAELDEALAVAEMQVDHLKREYNVSFTLEQEQSFHHAYDEGGRMSSFSMKAGRESFADRGKFYERMSLQIDDTDFEIEDLGPFRSRASSSATLSDKAPSAHNLLAAAASALTHPAHPFEEDMDYARSPRFSCLSYGSIRDSNISDSEWDPEL
ncbi:hypothetical protein ACHHYP_03745 [Achlya hypogyna]|uniref:Uncharacterized protein n=1 Tax=Achlya hypogyna TaxID=1202772 RepID=A0A1V9Z301_ACHHY|nr:hypothetical protein ACHHYP_03745 [Achlya hypogyna]